MATLAQLVTRWRSKLDDTIELYLWSNDELTDYANRIINSVCREVGLIDDSTTEAICTITIAEDDTIKSISNRITRITRAKLSSQTAPLSIRSVEWMDANVDDWENADSNTVSCLINKGVGRNKIRLHPPSDAIDALNLTVFRLPIADLDYTADSASVPDFPEEYHTLLSNGILWLAYQKQDTDAYDKKKGDEHYKLFRKDVDEMKQGEIKFHYREKAVQPALGNL